MISTVANTNRLPRPSLVATSVANTTEALVA